MRILLQDGSVYQPVHAQDAANNIGSGGSVLHDDGSFANVRLLNGADVRDPTPSEYSVFNPAHVTVDGIALTTAWVPGTHLPGDKGTATEISPLLLLAGGFLLLRFLRR